VGGGSVVWCCADCLLLFAGWGVLAKKGWNGLELLAAVAEAAQRATL